MKLYQSQQIKLGVKLLFNGLHFTNKNKSFLLLLVKLLALIYFITTFITFIFSSLFQIYLFTLFKILGERVMGGRMASFIHSTLLLLVKKITKLLHLLPEVFLILLKLFYPSALDDAFQSTLKECLLCLHIQPNRYLSSQSLLKQSKLPRPNLFRRILCLLKRYKKRMIWFMGMYLLSCVPTVGPLVFPFSTLILIRNRMGERVMVVTLCVAIISPPIRSNLNFIVFGLMMGYDVSVREQLDVYLSKSTMTLHEKRDWFKDNQFIIMGFCGPVFLLSRIPVIGPFVFIVGQTASARLLLEICER